MVHDIGFYLQQGHPHNIKFSVCFHAVICNTSYLIQDGSVESGGIWRNRTNDNGSNVAHIWLQRDVTKIPCTPMWFIQKHCVFDEGMAVACGYFVLINVVESMNANTVYVLTSETTCVNMLVSFTELTTNSKTLQALSGTWELFEGGGGLGGGGRDANFRTTCCLEWWLHWGKGFNFCNSGTLMCNTLYIMMITHRNWGKGNCKFVCSDWMKSESIVLIQK